MKFKKFMKVYLWVMGLLFPVFFALEIMDNETSDVFDYLDYLFWLVALIGIFGYCYSKEILTKQFWKAYLPFIIVWDIFITYRIISTEPEFQKLIILSILLIIFLVIAIPEYIAIYLYGKTVKNT